MARKVSFNSKKSLREWLVRSEKGRALLRSCMAEEMPVWLETDEGLEWQEKITKANGRAKVLVVAHGDGYFEVFTDKFVSVKFVDVTKAKAGSEVHQKLEEYAANDLPVSWQSVWKNGRLACNYCFRPLKVVDLVWREARLGILRKLGG
ncbi:MAG: hypothetical protein CMK32_10190 [Porticoccaceae bacterium]|nr:hypothetical protein [Porticoccaceae bacterium]